MQEDKPMSELIDEFNKIIDDLENIEVSLEDEYKASIMLNHIPIFYEHFKDAVIYERDQRPLPLRRFNRQSELKT